MCWVKAILIRNKQHTPVSKYVTKSNVFFKAYVLHTVDSLLKVSTVHVKYCILFFMVAQSKDPVLDLVALNSVFWAVWATRPVLKFLKF